MLEILPHLPSHVLGIQARGEVTAEDYRSVLIPAIEEKLAEHEKLGLLYVLGGDFEGYTGLAAWEDLKVDMRHFTDFDRIAVVTNVNWISRTVKAFGFIMPSDVRVFANEQLDEARSWISEAPVASNDVSESRGELEFELLEDSGVLVLEPDGELESSDFERIAKTVDPYIEETGDLGGLVIIADEFPGWDDFTAFTTHLRFLREHRANIHRVGVVTDSPFLSNAPKAAGPLLEAEVKRFPPGERRAAIDWAATKA